MKLELFKIADLKLDPENARKHNAKNLAAISKSFDEFDQLKNIVVDKNNVVIAGNGTVQTFIDKGKTEIWGVRSHLSEEKNRAFALADNRTAELAEWDTGNLEKVFEKLRAADIKLEDVGFEPADLDGLGLVPKNVGLTDDDAIPEIAQNIHGVARGDIWQLGAHRLMCGDSTKKEDVERLMAGEKADMVFTDPPYGIGLNYNQHDDSEKKWFDLINKVMPTVKQYPFVVMPCCRIKALKWWYENHSPDWIMCWYKGSPGHQSVIGFNDWEPHLVWGKPKKVNMHDYWQTKCGFEIEGHPCPKPVEYAQWIVERGVEDGDKVLDLFLGSGSTLIACEKTNRKCYGMEIDTHYCSVIIERFQNFSGKKAVRLDLTNS